MKYLYGDSTPSPLQSNFLAFLRDAMEFCVHVLLAQKRIEGLRDERRKLDQHADEERARIGGLRSLVVEAANSANTDGPESISQRAVERVTGAADQAIQSTLGELESRLASDRAAIAKRDRDERDACLDAFGRWIALHEPHEGSWKLSARLHEAGRYEGETSGEAPCGFHWKCAVDFQPGHPMLNVIRVGDLVTQIELPIPEASGWLKKNMKVRPQRIDPYVVETFATDGSEYRLELRTAPRAPTGIDVSIKDQKVRVTLVGGSEIVNIDVGEDDRQRLLTLRDRILEALTTHGGVCRRVLAATMDDAPLADGEDLRVVTNRLIAAAAPIVQQIRNHSLAPTELVIRRLLGNDRREEIFVATASLLEKVGRLPRDLRGLFAPLGLEWQRATTPPPFAAVVPPASIVDDDDEEAEIVELTAEPQDSDVATKPGVIDSSMVSEAAASVMVDSSRSADPPVAKATVEIDPSLTAAPSTSTQTSGRDDSIARGSSAELEVADGLIVDARNKDALAATMKRIVGSAREGKTPQAYAAYAKLFQDGDFARLRVQDQRQALKLMVMAKSPPPPSSTVDQAFRSARQRLEALVAETQDPADREMLSTCDTLLARA